MKEKVYFYTGNNEASKSILSYNLLIKKKLNTYKVIASNKLKKNSINIIMEGFDKKQYQEILKNKNKNFKVILIITEFLDPKLKTFNSFDKKKNFSLKYFFFYSLIYFYQLLKLNDSNWFKKIYNSSKLRKKLSTFHSVELAKDVIRHKKRFIYFEEILKISSLVYCSHENIRKDLKKYYSKKSYLIFPLLDKINKKKFSNKIKFSGSLTKYRKSILKNFDINFKNSGFFINNRNKSYVCSLHPKKNFQWLYSSPIRYIDAILFGEIPLTTDKFIDNYHNLLSIKLNSKDQYQFKYNINKYSLDIKNINNKISNFNKYIKKDDFNGKIKLKQIIQNVKKNI